MWLTVLSLSSLPTLLYIINFCFNIKVLRALFCVAIKREPVSLFRFPLFTSTQVMSCAISLIGRLKYPYICFSSYFVFSRFYFCLFFLFVLKLIILLLLLIVALFRLSLIFFFVLLLLEWWLSYSMHIFHASISWWSFTGWIASLLRPPEFFSVFWLI